MRGTAIAVMLIVMLSVFVAEFAVAEDGGIYLGPARPAELAMLPQRVSDASCDEAARMELRLAGLGAAPPPGYVENNPFDPATSRCDIEPVPCSFFEPEPDCYDNYIDVTNGGCNSTPNVFNILTPTFGMITVSGTSGTYDFGGLTYRDTDWYEIELTQHTSFVWTCIAEFPLQMLVLDGNSGCPTGGSLEYLSVPDCEEGVLELALAPGIYYLWIGPSVFGGVPCGSDYFMTIDGFYAVEDCVEYCPGESFLEEEPLCGLDYLDEYNSGCNSGSPVFQPLGPAEYRVICGETGVYPTMGFCYRDTDWYELVLDEPREVEFCVVAAFDYLLFVLQEVNGCLAFDTVLALDGPPCDVVCQSIELDPGTYWLWVGSWSWVPVDCGRNYVVTVAGYTTPVERTTWGSVKALYR